MRESALPVHVFAYLSVENTQVQANAPKALRGQIRKCDLTESRLGGSVFAEVQEFTTNYLLLGFFYCVYELVDSYLLSCIVLYCLLMYLYPI